MDLELLFIFELYSDYTFNDNYLFHNDNTQ